VNGGEDFLVNNRGVAGRKKVLAMLRGVPIALEESIPYPPNPEMAPPLQRMDSPIFERSVFFAEHRLDSIKNVTIN
jgi:hypothetical protein